MQMSGTHDSHDTLERVILRIVLTYIIVDDLESIEGIYYLLVDNSTLSQA